MTVPMKMACRSRASACRHGGIQGRIGPTTPSIMKPMSCRGELISLKVVPAGNEDSAHSVEDERSSSTCCAHPPTCRHRTRTLTRPRSTPKARPRSLGHSRPALRRPPRQRPPLSRTHGCPRRTAECPTRLPHPVTPTRRRSRRRAARHHRHYRRRSRRGRARTPRLRVRFIPSPQLHMRRHQSPLHTRPSRSGSAPLIRARPSRGGTRSCRMRSARLSRPSRPGSSRTRSSGSRRKGAGAGAVSYTHLTLPTIYSV